MQLKKKWKDFNNVAIKREKSNVLALAFPSVSNMGKAKPRKSLKKISSTLLKRGIFRSCRNIQAQNSVVM